MGWFKNAWDNVKGWVSDTWDNAVEVFSNPWVQEAGVLAAAGALAFVPGMQGAAVHLAVTGTGLVLSHAENEDKLDIQEKELDIKQETLDFQKEQSVENLLAQYETSIATAEQQNVASEEKIFALNQTINDYEHNIGVYNDWLSDYQNMVAGDRTSIIGQQVQTYENAVTTAQAQSNLYNTQAAMQKDQLNEQGFQNYAQMMKQKSFANMVAGATGERQGAYSAAAVNQQNMISKYVGIDNAFNTTNSEQYQSGQGNFLRTMTALNQEISTQKTINDASLFAARANLNAYRDNLETTSDQYTFQVGQMTESITKLRETIATELQSIKTNQDSVIAEKLKSWKKNAEELKMEDDEINQFLNSKGYEYDSTNDTVKRKEK